MLGREESRRCQGQRVGGCGFADLKLGASADAWAAVVAVTAVVAWVSEWRLQWWHGRVVGGAPQVSMDQVRGEWTSQDRRPEQHTKASESEMAVMD